MAENPRPALLAKRPHDRHSPTEPETLLGHSRAVVKAFTCMFGSADEPTRMGQRWLGFFKLDLFDNWVRFHRAGTAACALHDIGKANCGFQSAVLGDGDAQVARHEHLSALILSLPSVANWLGATCHTDSGIVIPAVLGHHLKARTGGGEPPHWTLGATFSADRSLVTLQTDGIVDLLALTADLLNALRLDAPDVPTRWSFAGRQGWFDAAAHADRTRAKLDYLRRSLDSDVTLGSLLRAVRTAVVLADSAGSGLVREGKPLESWLKSAFDEEQLAGADAVRTKVIEPRIAELEAKGHWGKWHDFQTAADTLPARTLMLAPCGSGKTLAAWRWIAAQAGRRPVARVIFLYPTRGTATEGFRDYVSWAPEADAALVHGTSEYELQGMFQAAPEGDARRGRRYWNEDDDRLYALTYWQRRIFSATVDQFLGFMQHSYRSTCLMPLLADSIVVFDEIHSFDKSLFSALRRFLRKFDIPVLCMTASLPSTRIDDLRECGLAVFPTDLNQYQDLKTKAERPRYAVACLPDAASVENEARDAFARGKRVLWVVNTVDRCQTLTRRLGALCYHSRFKLDDRRKRHDEAVSAFKPDSPAVIAITTQVCEMSLDLDADVLISEFAPVTSLIQRMGRCNRNDTQKDRQGQVFLYPPESEKPYSSGDLAGVREFVAAVGGKTISQSDLQVLLEKHGPSDIEVDRYAAFLESGPWAAGREESLREGTDYTEDAILDTDAEVYRQLNKAGKPTDGLIVPVPRRFVAQAERIDRYGIAPADHYDERWGFMEKPYGKDET